MSTNYASLQSHSLRRAIFRTFLPDTAKRAKYSSKQLQYMF